MNFVKVEMLVLSVRLKREKHLRGPDQVLTWSNAEQLEHIFKGHFFLTTISKGILSKSLFCFFSYFKNFGPQQKQQSDKRG